MTGLRVYPLPERAGLRLVGDVDLSTHEVLQAALRPLVHRDCDVCVDLSEVTFVDVSGASLLVSTGLGLGGGRRMVLRQPPPALRRTLELFWAGNPSIEVVT